MKTIDRNDAITMKFNIGRYEPYLESAIRKLDSIDFTANLSIKNPSLWNQDEEGIKSISNRLGWIDIAEKMSFLTSDITDFVNELLNEGYKDAVLMGMGGSSLSPEVSRLTFGIESGYMNLHVLDTTDPLTISKIENSIDINKTIFIAATKSGTTIETISLYKYFYKQVSKINKIDPGKNFIAITDPGTPLIQEAYTKRFRKVFENPADIGGRYSALSYFGLIPAAIIGADIDEIINRSMNVKLDPSMKASDNEGVILGCVIGELAKNGRDKLTFIASPEITAFSIWAEQLIAESTGKSGKGIIPIEGEIHDLSNMFGDDRQFVYLRLNNGDNLYTDTLIENIERYNHPIITINLDDKYDIGREYLRWEIATSTASAILEVNSFNEPNVKESKDNTKILIDIFDNTGKLQEIGHIISDEDILIYGEPNGATELNSYLQEFINNNKTDDYFAIMAFLPYDNETYDIMQKIRMTIEKKSRSAATLGYGPRFLHSTGQLHKGGPDKGIFIQFTADDTTDIPIPEISYSFGILKKAQADGDLMALKNRNSRYIRIHLGSEININLERILDIISE